MSICGGIHRWPVVSTHKGTVTREMFPFDDVILHTVYTLSCFDLHIIQAYALYCWVLTHWGRVTHICVVKLNIISYDNGLSPGRRQAIIGTNAGILLIGNLGTNFSEIWIEIYTVSFKKMHLKMSSRKWRPFGLGLNVLTEIITCHRRQTWMNVMISNNCYQELCMERNEMSPDTCQLSINVLNKSWSE